MLKVLRGHHHALTFFSRVLIIFFAQEIKNTRHRSKKKVSEFFFVAINGPYQHWQAGIAFALGVYFQRVFISSPSSPLTLCSDDCLRESTLVVVVATSRLHYITKPPEKKINNFPSSCDVIT
jgi:hypothetical protein